MNITNAKIEPAIEHGGTLSPTSTTPMSSIT